MGGASRGSVLGHRRLSGDAGRKIVVAVGLIWLLYAVYETGMRQRWLCSGECNIRFDLLLIYPLLLVLSVLAGVSLLGAARARRPR